MQDGRTIQDGAVNLDALEAIVYKDGRSVRALAREVEVSPAYMSKIIRGERTPKLAVALRLASVLGVKLASFYTVSAALSAGIDVLEAGSARAS